MNKNLLLKSTTFSYLSLLAFLLLGTVNTQAEEIVTESIPTTFEGDTDSPFENTCENSTSYNNYVDFIQDMPILFLPVVTVNDSDEVYSLTFQGIEKNNELFMQLINYCRIDNIDSITNNMNPAILTSATEIYVPTVQIGNDNFSGYLHLDPLPTDNLPINHIFTQQTPIFKIVGIQQKLKYPVLFVHGINSEGATWDSYKLPWQANKRMSYGGNILITDKYHISELGDNANSNRTRKTPVSFLYEVAIEEGGQYNSDFYTMNFSNNSDISFAAQGLQLREVVNQITEWTGKEGVYIVAHSMGGLASRAYLQYFNDGKVKGLITIGTPHFGSPLGSIGSYTFFGDVAKQLQVASEDLAMLNDINTYPLPSDVKYFAVVVRGKDTAGSDNLYSDDSGDGIVPTYSQAMGGWNSQEIIIEEDEFTRVEVHTLETENPDIRLIVWDKLISW